MKIQYEDQEVEVEIDRSDGCHTWNRIKFTAYSSKKIENVGELQRLAGYHPCGYDGPWNVTRNEVDGCHTTKWQCSASCD